MRTDIPGSYDKRGDAVPQIRSGRGQSARSEDMESSKEKFMRRALELAAECAALDEVPVGAVVVKDGEIIAESGNRKERDGNALRHAETVALSAAAEKVGNWWLEGCELFVTLEPCAMCAGAMINARIDRLYFGAYDEKAGAAGSKVNLFQKGLFNHTVEVEGGIMAEESAELLGKFFRAKREAARRARDCTESK